jgi:hypothetical protein
LEAALHPVVARAAASLRPGRLEGFIDRVSATLIEGWAFDIDHPDMPVLLEVVLDDHVLFTALACDFRADLRQAGKGSGRCAFSLVPPVMLPDAWLPQLRVRREADRADLPLSMVEAA